MLNSTVGIMSIRYPIFFSIVLLNGRTIKVLIYRNIYIFFTKDKHLQKTFTYYRLHKVISCSNLRNPLFIGRVLCVEHPVPTCNTAKEMSGYGLGGVIMGGQQGKVQGGGGVIMGGPSRIECGII